MLRLKGDLAKVLNTQNVAKEALFDPNQDDAIELDSNAHTSFDITQHMRKITDAYRISKEIAS
jgi:hypothetical protein